MSKLLLIVVLTLLAEGITNISAITKRQNAPLGAEYYDQPEEEDDYVPPSPCNVARRGDPDFTTYDIISSYHFDEYQYKYQGVQSILGSTGYQTAYHIEDYSNMTIESSQAFPKGVPDEFSFECTFRVPQLQPVNEWFLFELTDYRYESQMSVTMNPAYNTIQLSLPKYDGSIQTVSFEETEIFDRSWHNVMFGVTQESVRLWIDCKAVPDRSGSLRAPLEVRSPIDASEGAFSVARDCRTKSTVPIDLQWMIFSCDVDKPEHATCEDIPKYPVTPKGTIQREPSTTPIADDHHQPESTPTFDLSFLTSTTEIPWFLSSTPAALQGQEIHACPEQCPRGPPGPAGPPGPQGLMGVPGNTHPTADNLEAQSIKGDKGEPGLTGLAGRDGIQGEKGVPGIPGRIGIAGMRGEPGPRGLPGLQGLPGVIVSNNRTGAVVGPAGQPGIPGSKGDTGAPGVQGLPGEIGATGLPGVSGLPGVAGAEGGKGERGMPGLDGANGTPGGFGPAGARGEPGYPGEPGPPGVSGTVDNEIRNIDEREIREICMSVVRDYISEISNTLVGPPGPPGRRGSGRAGPRGSQGIQGETGPQGPHGERGYPGVPGLPGSNGDQGPRGTEGPKGERGEEGVGRDGPPGLPGPQGADGHGIDGIPGRSGERGDAGRAGEPGTRGPPGQPGICPDCSAYQASYAYPLMLAQQQQSNKGPPSYYNKGPQNYYNKGP